MMSFKRLNQRLSIDALTGQLYWKARQEKEFSAPRLAWRWNDRYAEKKVKPGKWVNIDGVRMDQARVTYTLMTGRLLHAECKVYFIDGDCTNFRYGNLTVRRTLQPRKNEGMKTHDKGNIERHNDGLYYYTLLVDGQRWEMVATSLRKARQDFVDVNRGCHPCRGDVVVVDLG